MTVLMKHLYLLRHAHSPDKGVGFTDKQRDLSPIGVNQSIAVSQFISRQKYPIECIITSDANRAKATATLVAEQLKLSTDRLQFESSMYQASIPLIMDILHVHDHYHHILLVGHNPTLSYFAEYLTGEDIGEVPTGTLLFLRSPILSWKQLTKDEAELVEKFIPD